jgi:hypothetical protein
MGQSGDRPSTRFISVPFISFGQRPQIRSLSAPSARSRSEWEPFDRSYYWRDVPSSRDLANREISTGQDGEEDEGHQRVDEGWIELYELFQQEIGVRG